MSLQPPDKENIGSERSVERMDLNTLNTAKKHGFIQNPDPREFKKKPTGAKVNETMEKALEDRGISPRQIAENVSRNGPIEERTEEDSNL